MPKVSVLPDHIASQIAAGEVVERPSSVVKELVENALDAGATQIDISISADCRDIRIADNGCGMDPDDAVLAFQRHATSKLSSADDLWSLDTLGFRGEAIPSIASISRFTCTTRTQEAETGTRVETVDGQLKAVETGCAPGTVMEVQELFFNTPARLKFMKKANTEFGHIHETIQALAIAYPHCAFTLSYDGTNKLCTTGQGDLAATIVEAGFFTGREPLVKLDPEKTPSLRLHGYLAKPTHFRGDRKSILTIVNGRAVRCPLTYKALDYAYSDLIPRGRYPLAVVVLDVDPKLVDVNIHPTKRELKYSHGNDIYINIQCAIVSALRQAAIEAAEARHIADQDKPVMSFMESPVTDKYEPSRAPRIEIEQISFRDSLATSQLIHAETARPRTINFQPEAQHHSKFEATADLSISNKRLPEAGEVFYAADREVYELPPDWRIMGYLHNTYIFVETSAGLEIIEQHIAHERTLYERLLVNQTVTGRITEVTQELIVSAPLQLNKAQVEILKNGQEALQKLGFTFEFGSDDASVKRLPIELSRVNYVPVIQKMIDDIATTDNANLELEATKSIACQSAIKNGMPLSAKDIIKLLCDWLATERNDTCPHGRPVRLKFTMDGLFQMFHPQ